MQDMGKIYSSCDILLKMSRIEDFLGRQWRPWLAAARWWLASVRVMMNILKMGENALVVRMGVLMARKRGSSAYG